MERTSYSVSHVIFREKCLLTLKTSNCAWYCDSHIYGSDYLDLCWISLAQRRKLDRSIHWNLQWASYTLYEDIILMSYP
jgi:hypothetical protein